MKTFKTYKNNLKQNIMYRLTLLFSVLFVLNTNAKISNNSDYFTSEKNEIENLLFANVKDSNSITLNVSDINVIELEEEAELGFDTNKFLPENFNAIKGKYDLDWSSIELIEIEEEVTIDFDTTMYLPYNFNPHASMLKDVMEVCFY